jgi:hypothetical protein
VLADIIKLYKRTGPWTCSGCLWGGCPPRKKDLYEGSSEARSEPGPKEANRGPGPVHYLVLAGSSPISYNASGLSDHCALMCKLFSKNGTVKEGKDVFQGCGI